jgi:uncharacterized protein (TIGR03435 family)
VKISKTNTNNDMGRPGIFGVHAAAFFAAAALSLFFLSTLPAGAQTPAASAVQPAANGDASAPMAFELADVHPSPHRDDNYYSGGVVRGGRYDLRNATMLDLIGIAYKTPQERILGGPPWIGNDRFDIAAKVPQRASNEDANEMIKALLADRFKLVVHTDTKPLPVYGLTVGKSGKPKLKQSDGAGESACQGQPQAASPTPDPSNARTVVCHNMTMEQFAEQIRYMAGGYLSNPVVDQTGLKGNWDFELKWTGRGMLAQAGSEGISVFDAVDKQLGLKLEAQKLPTDVLIVDSVNEKPTDNPPGVTANIPAPPPAQFEVAVIKPSGPDERMGGNIDQAGNVNAQAMPLKMMVEIAWNIENDDLVAGPKFMDSEKFDLMAKPSTDGPRQIDEEDGRAMLKALLIDRFKITFHMEDRPVNGYTLTASNPKLQKADPLERSECKEGPGADGKDPRIANPARSRLLTCTNTTMAQFVDAIRQRAGGYVQNMSVLDSTGLEGAYDFTINFSTANAVGLGRSGPGARDGNSATSDDPSGAISLFEALSKQLGLKLEERKHPMPVLVIDHIEEKPTDN